MFKKVVLVMMAGGLFVTSLRFEAGMAATRRSLASSSAPSSSGRSSSAQSSRSKTRASGTRRARGRRRSRRRVSNPWRITSFGQPSALDDPRGEDPAIRQIALQALGKWNGSVVVVDPNNGRILSIINQKLALHGAFMPCSTLKPVVGLAALKEGLITSETRLRAEARFRAYGSHGRITLTEALAHSSNLFFLQLGEMLGFARLSKYAHDFGLGERAGDDIPGEVPGRFPIRPPKEGGVGFVAYTGQDVEVTALQLAAIVSAIANGGTLYELQYPRTAEEIEGFTPKIRRQLDDVAPYLQQVKEGMAAAVLYGTGKLAYDPLEQIYGKTGTCSENGARLGWFISYDQQPKYVVVVLLRGGRPMYGPHAAEIAGRFYRELRQKEQALTQASSRASALHAPRP